MTPLDEWRAAAGLSNDAERNHALASWAVKHGRELAEQADPLYDLSARVSRYWTGLRWVPWEHRRFLAAGWKQMVAKLREQAIGHQLATCAAVDDAHEESYRAGWHDALDAAAPYIRRALAECDPKTRAAIEADAREDGVL